MSELGNRLKEARLSKGLSLDDLQNATKIQKRYLVGIEEGNYSMMPGKFYVRAFIKQYAEAVGIEIEELLVEFKDEIPATMNDDIPEKLSRVQARPAISNNSTKILSVLPKILITIFVIGFLVLIWYLLQQNAGVRTNNKIDDVNKDTKYETNLKDTSKSSEKENKKSNKTKETNKSETKPAPVAPQQELAVAQTNGNKTTYDLKNTDKFQLKVVSTGETWVNILNDKGHSFFQGILKKGATESQSIDFTNETGAVIVVGKSTETEIYVNDQKLEFAVSPTQSVRQDITINFVKSKE
ncbi:RodZ family helix-turn-helix domain-containing protein [Bacillus sp. 03113]|uniref:helix-turn-helix domain-containing protein n=1 Tax=Bacillus sp. 03113 TaxID=2578211 RepID=UPI001142EBF0